MAKNDEPTVAPEADPLSAVGYHVVQGKTFCGTFETEEDAQAFIDQQVKPQGLEAKIVSNVE